MWKSMINASSNVMQMCHLQSCFIETPHKKLCWTILDTISNHCLWWLWLVVLFANWKLYIFNLLWITWYSKILSSWYNHVICLKEDVSEFALYIKSERLVQYFRLNSYCKGEKAYWLFYSKSSCNFFSHNQEMH